MHNHGENKQSPWMMWAMVLCCAMPLVLILILGTSGKASGAPTWVIFSLIAVMIIAHFFMMSKSHKHSDKGSSVAGNEDKNKEDKGNNASL